MARSNKAAAAKGPEKVEWASLPMELYERACCELVTFSHKTVNSNAPQGGIRLAPEQGLKLPYLSARTLLGTGQTPALDYVANKGKMATAVKQLNLLQEGFDAAPPDEARRILAALTKAATEGAEIGTERVSLRARQLLLPKADGYVAVTPLTAGGVSRKLRAKVREHNDRLRETRDEAQRYIRFAILGLGGSNPQNVGSLVRDMQRPLIFFAPTENRQLKAALALHFQGVRIRLPRPLLRSFRDWRADCRRRNGGQIPTNMSTREEEITHIRQIAEAVLAMGDAARENLLVCRDALPSGGNPLVSSEASHISRGLVDPGLRDKEWREAFALQLARMIADYPFDDGKEGFQFEQADLFELQAMVKEVVR